MSRQHILLGLLFCTTLASFVYATRERLEASATAYSRDQYAANLADARARIQSLSSRIDALTAAAPAIAPAPAPAVQSVAASTPVARRTVVARATVKPKVNPEELRWRRVESQLAEHRERIAQTQVDVRRTGDQLDGKINSTRDELNQSIARTHDDVMLLQRRGERRIHEFDLGKSKQFQRVGPISLSLRKADTKHRNYDLSLLVDDKPVEKQRVNLLEPVWITFGDSAQPIQLVVNQIDKNRVRGYIAEPRYRNTDLGIAPAPAVPQGPALKSR